MTFDDCARALDLLENIDALREAQAHLIEKLRKSLALATLWPEAFDAGPTKSWVSGPPRSPRFTIERGDGARRSWPVEQVPAALLPDLKRGKRR